MCCLRARFKVRQAPQRESSGHFHLSRPSSTVPALPGFRLPFCVQGRPGTSVSLGWWLLFLRATTSHPCGPWSHHSGTVTSELTVCLPLCNVTNPQQLRGGLTRALFYVQRSCRWLRGLSHGAGWPWRPSLSGSRADGHSSFALWLLQLGFVLR